MGADFINISGEVVRVRVIVVVVVVVVEEEVDWCLLRRE